jgi:Arc/MetJ-type ribon-helix-helix transcriptional regulator
MMNHHTIPERRPMSVVKTAITIDQALLVKLDRLVQEGKYPSRSRAIQAAVAEKLTRLERSRLAVECAKLDPLEEQALADEGIGGALGEWPEY